MQQRQSKDKKAFDSRLQTCLTRHSSLLDKQGIGLQDAAVDGADELIEIAHVSEAFFFQAAIDIIEERLAFVKLLKTDFDDDRFRVCDDARASVDDFIFVALHVYLD